MSGIQRRRYLSIREYVEFSVILLVAVACAIGAILLVPQLPETGVILVAVISGGIAMLAWFAARRTIPRVGVPRETARPAAASEFLGVSIGLLVGSVSSVVAFPTGDGGGAGWNAIWRIAITAIAMITCMVVARGVAHAAAAFRHPRT